MYRLTDEPRTISMCMSVDEGRRYNRLWEYENTGLTPDEIAAMQAEITAYRQAEQDGELVRVIRCKDCAHGVPLPEKASKCFSDCVRHCRMYRGDDDKTFNVSAVWEDGYCDEGKPRAENGREKA